MFKNDKYITCGINERLPLITQLFLWDRITQAEEEVELDYLQVFQLSVVEKGGVTMQRIIHTQENPKYKNDSWLVCEESITAKVFCIDDGDHSTMLFAEEY